MQRGGSAGERDGMAHAKLLGEFTLEGIDMRPQRSDPIRIERIEQQLALGCAKMGRRQMNAARRWTCGATAGAARGFSQKGRDDRDSTSDCQGDRR